MKKYHAILLRRIDVDVEADTIELAQDAVKQIVAQFPEGTAKLHSITAEDYVPPEEGV